jgi:hypothetical protein
MWAMRGIIARPTYLLNKKHGRCRRIAADYCPIIPGLSSHLNCHREATRQRPAMATAKIAPSMLSSDFANLASEAERMLRLGADWLHMDIMVRSPYSPANPIP